MNNKTTVFDDADVISRIADVIQLNINQALADSGYTHPVKEVSLCLKLIHIFRLMRK